MTGSLVIYSICLILTLLFTRTIYTDAKHVNVKVLSHRFVITNMWYRVVLLAFPLGLILSIRYGIGTDYFNYKIEFLNSVNVAQTSLFTKEVGFKALMRVTYSVFGSYEAFIVVSSSITVFLMMYWVVKNSSAKDITLAVLVLFVLYIGILFNNIQQALAIFICTFAITNISKNRFWRFLIIILIAITIHLSAILVLPCYFLIGHWEKTISTKIKLLKIAIIIVLVIGLCFAYTIYAEGSNIIYSQYISSSREGGRIPEFFYLSLLFYIPEVYYAPKMIGKGKEFELYYILIVIEAILFISSFFIAYAFRLGLYFSVVHALLIPQITSMDGNRKQLLTLYYVISLLFFFIFMYVIKGYNGMIPYDSIFSH